MWHSREAQPVEMFVNVKKNLYNLYAHVWTSNPFEIL